MRETPTVSLPDLARAYRDHAGRVYALALRMTGSRAEAEDITQETFLAAHRYLDTFRGDSAISTWLLAIARTFCLKLLKGRSRTGFASLETLLEQGREFEDPDASRRFSEPERADLVRQVKEGCLSGLLRCLTPDQRAAFILHVLFGLPLKDTGRVLGKTVDAAKALAHRARKAILAFVCRNCSLYDRRNPCRCEGMVHFSLKQGWIAASGPGEDAPLDAPAVERELREIKKLAALYRGLDRAEPPDSLRRQLLERARAALPGDGEQYNSH